MNTSIKTIIKMVILVVTLQSCNQDLSLQSYYVDSELAPGFTTLDVPTSMLKIDETTLTEEQKEAYESIEKLSLLAFVVDESNKETMDIELAKVKAILKDPKYEELMRGGNSTDGKFVIKCIGDGDDVDEFILLGNSNASGFAVVRVLGDDMNFSKIMNLASVLENSDMDNSQLKNITKFFK
ncbi:DUF4252 domain-containing protein [Psychroserpens algicola]|uniref:DUF4252 domain-containing protein n=1 Tax=Psychroserpens algicola TaxID=1719034 RepID=A0ABT0H5G1_9FLAO|nr:DUF4252 domain-containing protein [Psychroserpens algicola]MCK8479427.1 DUF4252 domain-containing protein [Psychroserpens algicola]